MSVGSRFQPIAKLTETYDPDIGGLPALLRAYAAQDGLQLYSDATVRDSRLWTQLRLAADHVEFIRFIRRYTTRYPGTKAATELLFLLDQLVQGSLDAFLALFAVDPERDLRSTRDASPLAYEVIVNLRHYTTGNSSGAG